MKEENAAPRNRRGRCQRPGLGRTGSQRLPLQLLGMLTDAGATAEVVL
jgi:hypothetical protein